MFQIDLQKLIKMFVLVVSCALVCVCIQVESFTLIQTGQQCGVEASSNLVHHNPWLVLIDYYRHEKRVEIRCSGTLIDSRHVVTAAHCVKESKFTSLKVRLGEYDLFSQPDCVQGVCTEAIVHIEVEKIIPHPLYDGKNYDIAILRMKEEAPYTDFIRPVCLPTGEFQEDTTFSASGWGEIPYSGQYSHVKKVLLLPFMEKDKCQKAYKRTVLPERVICAGGEEGIDTCRGDSGGPLIWIKEKAELWGVTSAGNVHCGSKGTPGIYTRVIDYLDWITAVVNL